MKAPRLNRLIVLEARVRAPDGAGGYSENWQTLGQVWAEITPGRGRDTSQAGLSVSLVPYKVVIRAAPVGSASRPEPRQRFRDGSRIYNIRAVAERDADARYLTCYVEEEIAA